MNNTIVCLVGPSGSGKTTIAKALEKWYGYNVIQSYTTRPPREENEWGHTFVKERPFALPVEEHAPNVIAYNFYNGHHYWATKEQYQDHKVSIYVIDPEGADMLKRTVTDTTIYIVALWADQDEREYRMWKRMEPTTEEQAKLLHDDIQQRLVHDKEVFRIIECDVVIDTNFSLEDVAPAFDTALQTYKEVE